MGFLSSVSLVPPPPWPTGRLLTIQDRHLALPPNLQIKTIYKDFLAYLLRETRRYLQDTTGSDLWGQFKSSTRIVFTNPNGWGRSQQEIIQGAAFAAELISIEGLVSRTFFVEEGEAAATFCLVDQPAFADQLKVKTLLSQLLADLNYAFKSGLDW